MRLCRRTADFLWQWSKERRRWVFDFASYIKSAHNVIEDRAPRRDPADKKWLLARWAFRKVVVNLGIPEIDLFASRCNAKCKAFFPWFSDPEAIAVDAFTCDWGSCRFFLGLSSLFLDFADTPKIITDRARGIVVVPD